MAKGINIPFIAEVRDFLRGTKNVEDALDDVVDSLDDVAKEADTSGEKAADAFKDVEDAAEDAGKAIDNKFSEKVEEAADEAKPLEKKFKDAFDNVKDASKTAGDSVGKNVNDGFDKAKEGADEFKDEAQSTAKEAAASFDGSADSIADAFQEVAANAFAGFGPAGQAAGLAAALGIGVAISKLQEVADKINEVKEQTGELALEFKDAGGRLEEMNLVGQFDEWLVQIQDARSWFEIWQKDAITNLDNVKEAIEGTGISLGDLYNAFSENDTTALRDYVELLKDVNREIAPDGHYAATAALQEEYNTRKDAITGLEQEIEKREEAEKMAYEMRAAEEGITVEVLKQRDAMAQRNDELQENIDLNREVIDGELDYLDTLDQTTAKLQENAAAGWDKNTAAGRENLRALGDISSAALDYADSITEAGGSQEEANRVIAEGRQKVIDAGTALGMTEQQAQDYATSLGLIPKEVSTTAKANTGTAEQQLNNVARDRDVRYKPWISTADLQSAANAAAQNIVSPYVEVKTYVSTRV